MYMRVCVCICVQARQQLLVLQGLASAAGLHPHLVSVCLDEWVLCTVYLFAHFLCECLCVCLCVCVPVCVCLCVCACVCVCVCVCKRVWASMYIFVIVRFAATLSTASKGQDMHALLTCSVSQNRTYTPYMTSSLVISLPKILLTHHIWPRFGDFSAKNTVDTPYMTSSLVISLPKILLTHHIWPRLWWFLCQKYCRHTIYDLAFGDFSAKNTAESPYMTSPLVISLPKILLIYHIWPRLWWFLCQKYCWYTVYICMVLANPSPLSSTLRRHARPSVLPPSFKAPLQITIMRGCQCSLPLSRSAFKMNMQRTNTARTAFFSFLQHQVRPPVHPPSLGGVFPVLPPSLLPQPPLQVRACCACSFIWMLVMFHFNGTTAH